MSGLGNKLKVLVDGNCIVCDLEVSHYYRKAPDVIQMVDISAKDFDAKNFGLSSEAVNVHLHVIDPSGGLHVGVDAFAKIWEQIPAYRWASKVIRMPFIYPLAKFGYLGFTKIRPYLPKKNRL